MAAEPALEPTITREEEQGESDEGEESDDYEVEGEEEGDSYAQEEDEEDEGDGDEGAGEVESGNMTALLLGKQNGTMAEEDEEDDYDEDDDEDDEYHENGEGITETSSVVAGSKRGADELSEGGTYGDEDGAGTEAGAEGENLAKKARVYCP